MLDRHIARSGRAPRQTAADGGYASRANLTAAKARGVADVAFHKKCGIAVADMVKSPWVYRRRRNFRAGIEAGDLLLQTRLWRCTLHLARARPLQGLHLVGGSGPQPGGARPPETGLASPAAAGDSAAGQINPTDPARYTIPSPRAATATRKCADARPNHTTARLATPLKIMRLWTGTS
jgi:hypothetical protein